MLAELRGREFDRTELAAILRLKRQVYRLFAANYLSATLLLGESAEDRQRDATTNLKKTKTDDLFGKVDKVEPKEDILAKDEGIPTPYEIERVTVDNDNKCMMLIAGTRMVVSLPYRVDAAAKKAYAACVVSELGDTVTLFPTQKRYFRHLIYKSNGKVQNE